jgi:hypothetical protein
MFAASIKKIRKYHAISKTKRNKTADKLNLRAIPGQAAQ